MGLVLVWLKMILNGFRWGWAERNIRAGLVEVREANMRLILASPHIVFWNFCSLCTYQDLCPPAYSNSIGHRSRSWDQCIAQVASQPLQITGHMHMHGLRRHTWINHLLAYCQQGPGNISPTTARCPTFLEWDVMFWGREENG